MGSTLAHRGSPVPFVHCPDADSVLLQGGWRTAEAEPGPLTPYECVGSTGISEPASYPVTLLPELDVFWGLVAALAVLVVLRELRE